MVRHETEDEKRARRTQALDLAVQTFARCVPRTEDPMGLPVGTAADEVLAVAERYSTYIASGEVSDR